MKISQLQQIKDGLFIMIDNLITTKEEIKTAITSRDIEVTDGMIKYGDFIRQIPSYYDIPGKLKFGDSDFTVGPDWDMTEYTNTGYMFNRCFYMTNIPLYNISNVTNTDTMFGDCEKLTTIPQLNTSKVKTGYSMFFHCIKLNNIPLLDFSSMTDSRYMFCNCSSLTNLEGFKNFGMQENLKTEDPDIIPINTWVPMFFGCTAITRQSCINIFNNLYDRASAGYSIVTISFESEVIARLTDEDIAIAANKGWNITTIIHRE